MRFTSSIGMILLSVYLIVAGVGVLAGFAVPPVLMGVLAVAAGVLILIGK